MGEQASRLCHLVERILALEHEAQAVSAKPASVNQCLNHPRHAGEHSELVCGRTMRPIVRHAEGADGQRSFPAGSLARSGTPA